ncbi:LysR family transcriptional regulator [uncultured Variovorax sp.]|uniref:LysR family transcriptional regulator n=1 Tax=uncultured Variovorax sp. TaxID=114708 RepID=UPI0025DE9F05|nr:LysR family transcriptional regulator [uncultured Variovorax sp.]
MHIHARALLYFDAIRCDGSIRGAARRLFVDASAVNRQLIQLEQEVGFPLFERLSNGLKLTPAGELFARHTTHVLQDQQWLANELDMLRGVQRGEVHVVGVEAVYNDLLPEVVAEMLGQFPGVRMQASLAGSADIAAFVTDARADVGVAFNAGATSGVTRVAGGEFQIGAIVAADHPLARSPRVNLERCAEWPLLLGSADLAAYALVEAEISALPSAPCVALRSASIELMKRLAASGHGIAFQTRLGLARPESGAQGFAFVPLIDSAGNPVVSDLGVYVRTGRTLPPAVTAFVDCLADVMARHADCGGLVATSAPG